MFNLNVIKANLGSTHPLYNQHEYDQLKSWFKKERKGILLGENNFDLFRYTLLFARDFVKEHPLSVVKLIDSRDEAHFYAAISDFCVLLVRHQVTSFIRRFTLEALATIFKEVDFHVLIICYNCCETVLKLEDWHKFDHSLSKVNVTFLTTNISKSDRFSHRSLPVCEDNQILEYLRVPESEKADALQVIGLCNRSLVQLEVVNTFRRENNISFKELKESFSNDDIKIILNDCNDFSKLVSIVSRNVW